MGQSASNMKAAQLQQQSELASEGHWVSDIKTGYRWATDPIISGPDVVKKPLGNVVPQFENNNNLKMMFSLPKLPGEVWGPYRKKFTKSVIGGQVFTPPETIDDVPLLCRCRDIDKYMRDDRGGRMLQGFGAVVNGKHAPACWDDNESFSDFLGGMYFYVMTRHPSFYALAASGDGLLGVARNVASGPIWPVPLALGAMAFMRGGKTRRRSRGRKTTRKQRAKK
jgi:hypothetical protein